MKLMNVDLCRKLYESAPTLFGTNTFFIVEEIGPGITSYRWFPVQCDDGWFDLLFRLCTKLNDHIKTFPENIRKEIVITQIKEKYGTLRFHLSHYDPVVDKIIEDAEIESASICEVCGKAGRLRGKSWVYTACDAHTKSYDLIEKTDVETSVS
jgi:hypothetical protein